MLAFTRKSEQEKEPLQLGGVVKEAMKLLRASIPSTIRVRMKVENESGLLLADPTQMEQILMNLCMNAAHAMRERGTIIEVTLTDFNTPEDVTGDGMRPGPYMRLTVRDTGVGMSPEIVEKVFDPFFTTKKHTEGQASACLWSTASCGGTMGTSP